MPNEALQRTPNFELNLAADDIPGWEVIHKFGAATAVGTSPTIVASSKTYQTPTTAQAIEILSSAAADTAAGAGAQAITIHGLDADYVEQSEVIETSGITPVASALTWTRIYRAFVSRSGTYATTAASSHAGTITIRGASAGVTWATINLDNGLGLGQSEIGAFTVPAGKFGYITNRRISVEGTKVATVLFFQRDNADDVTTPYTGAMRVFEVARGVEGNSDSTFTPYFGPFVGPCDLGVFAYVGSGTVDVGVAFTLLLEDVNAV